MQRIVEALLHPSAFMHSPLHVVVCLIHARVAEPVTRMSRGMCALHVVKYEYNMHTMISISRTNML